MFLHKSALSCAFGGEVWQLYNWSGRHRHVGNNKAEFKATVGGEKSTSCWNCSTTVFLSVSFFFLFWHHDSRSVKCLFLFVRSAAWVQWWPVAENSGCWWWLSQWWYATWSAGCPMVWQLCLQPSARMIFWHQRRPSCRHCWPNCPLSSIPLSTYSWTNRWVSALYLS